MYTYIYIHIHTYTCNTYIYVFFINYNYFLWIQLFSLNTIFKIIFLSKYIHIRVYIRIHTYTYIYIHIHDIRINTNIYLYIHTYTCIHTYTYIDLGRTNIHVYTWLYIHIHAYTCVYINIQTSVNYCQEVFLKGGSRRPLATGWTQNNQTCCDRQWGWIVVHGSCMGDLHEEREGRSRGPGCVQRGGVRQIESAQTEPRAEKSGCSDAQGCPECGPPTATPRDCV